MLILHSKPAMIYRTTEALDLKVFGLAAGDYAVNNDKNKCK